MKAITHRHRVVSLSPLHCIARTTGVAFVLVALSGTTAGCKKPFDTGGATARGGANEPAGYTRLVETLFDETEPSGWRITMGGVNLAIVEDAAGPLSPSNVLRTRYLAGDIDPGKSKQPCELRYNTSVGTRRAYIELAIKMSSNYRNHQSSSSKLWWLLANTGGGGSPFFLMAPAEDIYDPTGDFSFKGHLQHNTLSNRSFGHNLKGQTQIAQRNTWYHLEMVLVMNTPGNADGEFHMWIDGDKVSEFTNVEWSDGPGYTWTTFSWTPVWGGQNDSIPEDFYVYHDHVYLSRSN